MFYLQLLFKKFLPVIWKWNLRYVTLLLKRKFLLKINIMLYQFCWNWKKNCAFLSRSVELPAFSISSCSWHIPFILMSDKVKPFKAPIFFYQTPSLFNFERIPLANPPIKLKVHPMATCLCFTTDGYLYNFNKWSMYTRRRKKGLFSFLEALFIEPFPTENQKKSLRCLNLIRQLKKDLDRPFEN